jgi:hypothetical protein
MVDMLSLLALSLAVATAPAAPAAQAQMLHLPKAGAPAFVVSAPPSWRATYDPFGNLQLMAPDRSGFVEFSMLEDPSIDRTPAAAVATAAFKSAGAAAFSRTQPGSIAGRPGEAFAGVITRAGVPLEMRVVLVKLDPTHYASVAVVRRQSATPAQSAALEALASRAQLELH